MEQCEFVEEEILASRTYDVVSDISFKIIQIYLEEELIAISKCDDRFGPISLKSKVLKEFIGKLENAHSLIIKDLDPLVKELFLLHQISKNLDRFNLEVLDMGYNEFRAKIFFPNIIYILVRYLQNARKFLQKIIKTTYGEVQRKSPGIINKYSTSYCMDPDIIKHDVLYMFLGNSLKKIDPLQVNNVYPFYRSVFRNVLFYYFRGEKNQVSVLSSINDIEIRLLESANFPTRLSIYRDVLFELQNEKFISESPALHQVGYNYNIFKNVILDNEFQNLCFSVYRDSINSYDNQYKLMRLYNSDIKSNDIFLEKLKQIPTIYRLLKCVRIVSNSHNIPYNDRTIKYETVKSAVLEELVHPFKNMMAESHLIPVFNTIATNFASSILSGEYINLLTLSTVYINQLSFIPQIRKFIRLCIDDLDLFKVR